MRTLIQRVTHGSVTVENKKVSEIDLGLVVLIGVGKNDTQQEADWLAEKIANLRIFEDDQGKMNRSVLEVGGSALVVSQFTLYADAQKGRRPSFEKAAQPNEAEPLIEYFTKRLQFYGVPIQSGVFRAMMSVEIINDGPVTVWIEK